MNRQAQTAMLFTSKTFLAASAFAACVTASAAADDFSFDALRATARKMAAAPFVEKRQELADHWKNLTYDQHRDIRFKMVSGLWAKEKLPFSIDFFHPGWTAKKTVMIHEVVDVDAEITLRRPVQQLGFAPFSTMFWFGEGTHPRPYDFRPEVHDSDGLLMELDSGNLHFRPLEHSKDQFRHCVFAMENPRSWSLVQRDRSFSSYQDLEARYHDRPGVRVEPVEGFGQGKLHLIEMPTVDETNDNVILLWEPQPALQPGKAFRFHYRLHWMRDPAPSGLFSVRATRCGSPVQQPDKVLMTVDFAKPLQPELKKGDPKWDDFSKLKPVVTVNQKSVKLIHAGLTDLSMANVDDLPAGLGRGPQIHMPQVVRAFFVLEPPKDLTEIDMTCELHDEAGRAVSERWVYLWKKPG